MGLGFAESYDLLQQQFEQGSVEPAVAGDIFVPSAEAPDLSLPVGSKIERSENLTVTLGTGRVAVTSFMRVILLDQMPGAAVDPDLVITYQSQPVPTMLFKRDLTWTKVTDRGTCEYSTRHFSGFTRGEMELGDESWQDYRREVAQYLDEHGYPTDFDIKDIHKIPNPENENDFFPFSPFFLTVPSRTAKPDIDEMPRGDRYDAEHMARATAIQDLMGEQRDLMVALSTNGTHYEVLRDYENLWGFEKPINYTPEQFLATTKWLLGLMEE